MLVCDWSLSLLCLAVWPVCYVIKHPFFFRGLRMPCSLQGCLACVAVCYICSLQSFFSAKSMLSLSRFLSLCAVVCVSHRAPACISHGRALCWLISAMFFAACFTHTRQILETKSLPLLSSALRHISTRLFVRDYWARCVLIILASICCGLPSGNLTVHPDQSDRRCCCCCCCCCCCSLLFCGN